MLYTKSRRHEAIEQLEAQAINRQIQAKDLFRGSLSQTKNRKIYGKTWPYTSLIPGSGATGSITPVNYS